MNDSVPAWYEELNSDIARRIEAICSLYPENDRSLVLSAIVRALHARASEIDPTGTWIHLALASANVVESDLGNARERQFYATLDHHPSEVDAENLAEDLSLLQLPCGVSSPLVAVRSAVLVAWTRFAANLGPVDRALLAINAAELA